MQTFLCERIKLWHMDPNRRLFLKVDVSGIAFGVFAFQLHSEHWDGESIPGKDIPAKEIRPICFLWRMSSNVEKRYGSTKAEIAGAVWAVRKLEKMVRSNKSATAIITDHAATKGIV